ncbi:type IVB secretion system protein IcmH/DotU, partial [Pseudomonas sp. DCB_PUT]
MSKESDGTETPVPAKKKPILLEDIKGTQQPRTGTGPQLATDLSGYPADPEFQLRGGFANLMLDAASPLFGLVIRLRTLDDLPNLAYVHKTVQNQVSNIREEIQQHGYPIVHQEVYSYALCLYLDEAVMSRPWGNNSCWSHQPLLSIFHDETQGGEKIFVLLERVMQAPREFQDVLE